MKELCDTYDINKNSFTFDGKAYSFIKDKTNKRLADKGLWNVECKIINVPIAVIVFKNDTYKFFDNNNQEIEAKPILRALLKIRKTKRNTRYLARKYFGKIQWSA